MNNYNRLINNLEVLKMDGIIKNLDNIIDRNVKGEIDFVEGLYELTHYQLEEKKVKGNSLVYSMGSISLKQIFRGI